MGLPAPVLTALSDFAEDAALERQSTRICEALSQLVDDFSSGPRKDSPPQDWEAAIGGLKEWEKSLKEDVRPTIERLKQVQKDLTGVAPAERPKATAMADRHINTILSTLEALRDARWQLMALRADVEDPGDAPVFENPDELLRYLRSKTK